MENRRFDDIGRYYYESGWCFRDALRIAGYPLWSWASRAMTVAAIRQFCVDHELDLRTTGEVDMAGRLGIYLYENGDGKTGHAVFCEDVRRVLDAGIKVIGVIVLEAHNG